MTHLVRGERVFLRPFEARDNEAYRRWRADARVMATAGFGERAPLSLAQVEKRLEQVTAEQGKDQYLFAICLIDDEHPIGEGSLFGIDRRVGSAELGIFIGEPEEWGEGYGTDAVNALVDFGFGELRLERIWLNVWTENVPARRAYEKAGFVREGRVRHDLYEHGTYTDGDIMSILRDEWLRRVASHEASEFTSPDR
ncbi:MAG TPA: GNAT family protein [Candidatus Limnocylindria bacterium]|nr:GNAT family protein [Candidatus Limnocylindria bacterium]